MDGTVKYKQAYLSNENGLYCHGFVPDYAVPGSFVTPFKLDEFWKVLSHNGHEYSRKELDILKQKPTVVHWDDRTKTEDGLEDELERYGAGHHGVRRR